LTISPASNSNVQRARPADGLEQAVATSSASSLPFSLRAAPRLLAQRRLQVAQHEASLGAVHRRAADAHGPADLLVADSCSGRQQDLRPLQLARRMLAATEQGLQLVAFRFAQLDPVPYIHSDLLEGETTRVEP
jgi:hypothetical protein